MRRSHLKNHFFRILTNAAGILLISAMHWLPQAQAQSSDSSAAPVWLSLAPDNIVAGSRFQVNIHVGTSAKPVRDLFGISFKLRFSHTDLIIFDKDANPDAMRGDLLNHPDTTLFLSRPLQNQGIVSIAHTRKYPADGVSGFGIVASLPFTALPNLPDSTKIFFEVFDVRAETKDAEPINLSVEPVIEVVALQPQNFRLKITPETAEINKGQSKRFYLTAESIGGFDRPIQLGYAPFIAGLSVDLASMEIYPGETVNVLISADDNIAPGAYEINFSGSADSLLHSVALHINVATIPIMVQTDTTSYLSTEPFDVRIVIGDHAHEIEELASLKFALKISNHVYLNLPESDEVVLLPRVSEKFRIIQFEQQAGKIMVEIQLEENKVAFSGAAGLLTMQLNSSIETPEGTRISFVLEQIDARNLQGDKISLSPQAREITIHEKNQFLLSLRPDSVTITAGKSHQASAHVLTNPAYSREINLSHSALLPGIQLTFNPPTLQGAGESLFTVSIDSALRPVNYQFDIIAADESDEQRSAFKLDVQPYHDFQLQVTPSFTEIHGGDSTDFMISVIAQNAHREPVQLQVIGLDNYERLSYSLIPDELPWDGTAELRIRTNEEIRTGEIRFQVLARVYNMQRYTDAGLKILPPPPPVLPNPFTPNGDGFNDVVVFNFPELRSMNGTVYIFNIAGKQIVRLTQPLIWDGIDEDGNAARPGAYLYVVKSKDKTLARGVLGLAK